MAPLTKSHSKGEIKEAFDEIDVYVNDEDVALRERTKSKFVGWVVSGMSHLLFLLIFGLIVYTQQIEPESELPPMVITSIEKTEKTKEKNTVLDKTDSKIDLEIKTDEEVTNPILFESTEIASAETLIDTDKPEPEGREDALSALENGSTSVFNAIGSAGGNSGAFGTRSPSGRKKGLGQYGENGKLAASTLDSGLRWLKKHQSPDGSWIATTYYVNCLSDEAKCEPGKDQAGDTNVAMTSFALLCFLGSGYDHVIPNKFKSVVEKGINYLISVQNQDGLFGQRNYEHAITTQVLAEAYAMTNDIKLKEPAQRAVNLLLSRQNRGDDKNNPYSLLGWDYVDQNPARNDLSVSGWGSMALKSAMIAGLNTGNGINGIKNLVEKSWKAANPEWTKLDPYGKSIFPYTYDGVSGKTDRDHLSFVGALLAVYTGSHSGNVMLETMLNDMDDRWLAKCSTYPHNLYASYYAMAASFQGGKTHFDKWKNAVIPPLLKAQRKDGCFDGSWDPAIDFHGADTGRVLSTCLALLDIEVVFRYDLVNKTK